MTWTNLGCAHIRAGLDFWPRGAKAWWVRLTRGSSEQLERRGCPTQRPGDLGHLPEGELVNRLSYLPLGFSIRKISPMTFASYFKRVSEDEGTKELRALRGCLHMQKLKERTAWSSGCFMTE